MTPKEKAKELVNKFAIYSEGGLDNSIQTILCNSKQCALIAVDEILQENSKRGGDNDEIVELEPYWKEVKEEIEKL